MSTPHPLAPCLAFCLVVLAACDDAAVADDALAELATAGHSADASLPVCTPQATAYEPGLLGGLPAGVGALCGLQSVVEDTNADGIADQVTDYVAHGLTVTVTQRHAKSTSSPSMVYTQDAQGRTVRVEVLDAKGAVTSADVRGFDAAGQLQVHESSSVSGYGAVKQLHVHRIEQTWVGSKLVQRRASLSHTGVYALTTWSYDGAGPWSQPPTPPASPWPKSPRPTGAMTPRVGPCVSSGWPTASKRSCKPGLGTSSAR